MENQVQPEGEGTLQPSAVNGLEPWQQEAIVYAVVALLLSCFSMYFNNSPLVRNAGFFAKVLAIAVGTGLGTIGALIGNALRKAVHPDAIFTTGGFWSLLWARVFWKWGPQTIGMLIGALFGIAMVLK